MARADQFGGSTSTCPERCSRCSTASLIGEKVQTVRILSGPANITDDVKNDFKRFQSEMKKERGIDVEWKVMSKAGGARAPRPLLHHRRE